jgi:hypothetical protein
MQVLDANRPIAAATVCLLVFGACIAAFLPPLNETVLGSVPFVVMVGLTLALSVILHLVFVGIAARRLGRSVPGWIAIAAVTFPIGSIIGLVLYEWFSDEADRNGSQRLT